VDFTVVGGYQPFCIAVVLLDIAIIVAAIVLAARFLA
jgi:hypothetical protein